ncbi:SAM-dependent methyltransferase [Dactylosporangium sp. NPDC048998]|uniref:SAM-dependent methyltransferase n=1 Tax=Dactylosporangium sp. NPDC048998 TaxID=3363976 RepID=UPI00371D7E34
MGLPEWVPDGVDITTPNAARVYDYTLGGFHNFQVDREFAEDAQRAWPGIFQLAHANRAYLGRAVQWLAKQGVRQFLDIGSGIPTLGNVHEVAQGLAPEARVMYVDIDPVAVAHSRHILAGNPRASAISGDLRRPEEILAHPEVLALLDFSEPVALLLMAVLHFVSDEDDPGGIIRRFDEATVSGSYVALSHGIPAEVKAAEQDEVRNLYRRTPTAVHLRTPQQVAGLFDGWSVIEPGLVPITEWYPDPEDDEAPQPAVLAALARKGADRP